MALDAGGHTGTTTKKVVEQLSSVTVGPPQASSGLTGDKAPTTIVTVEQIDQVRNQIYLEGRNLDALEKINTIGQVTNTQSTSGPIVGTMKIVTASTTGGGATVFRPANTHEVWEVVSMSQTRVNATGSTTTVIRLANDDGDNVLIEELADNSGEFPLNVSSSHPILVTYEVYLTAGYSPSGNADSITVKVAVVRVR